MPNYIYSMLHKYQHPPPKRAQHSPHPWNRSTYGATKQLTKAPDTTDPLELSEVKRIQKIVGTLLYYARAVDATILVALGTIASQQASATQATSRYVTHLLDYCHTHPDTKVSYHASDMILHIHSDASYNSEAKTRSRGGGHFCLGKNASVRPTIHNNGAILNTSTVMRNVMASTSEAECGALFNNTREAVALRTTLNEMGHPRPLTPVKVDNSTAVGSVNKQIKQQKSKSMDMRYYWIQDCVAQKHFQVYWRPSLNNLGDYFTKHFPPSYHRSTRSTYLQSANHVASLRFCEGCVDSFPGLSQEWADTSPGLIHKWTDPP